MRVRRRAYVVEEWGTGELWFAGDLVVHHVLPGTLHAGEGEERPQREHAALRPTPSAETLDLGPAPHMGGVRAPDESVRGAVQPDRADFATTLCRRFSRHLAGEPVSYADVAADLEWATPFQTQLVAVLRAVPWGEVVTYGELAALAGRPRAARAAGTLCAGNQLALIVPCHRVVAADGIGGYGRAGIAVKRRLLALEGVTV